MKQARNVLLAATLFCEAGNAFANTGSVAKDPFFSPRFYISLFAGLSYEKPDSDHSFHYSIFQVGVTLFQTERLMFGKVAFAALVGPKHNVENCPETSDSANCDIFIHPSIVFSPVLVKMVRWGGPRTICNSGALTFDIGIDHRQRLVAAFGLAF